MLETVTDVHQLTIILGHEMAHALLGHSVSIKASVAPRVIHYDTLADYRSQISLTFKDSLPVGVCVDDLGRQHTQP